MNSSAALPFVKLQHFLHSSAGTQTITSGMFWSYLKFLITFFFIYYIFYIFYGKTHFAAVYSLLTLEGSAHLQVPEGQKLRCRPPAVLPQGVLPTCEAPPSFLPGGRGGRAAGPRPGHPGGGCSPGCPADTLQLLSSRHSQESDVTLPRRWIHLLRYRAQIALRWNGQADSSPRDFFSFFFF